MASDSGNEFGTVTGRLRSIFMSGEPGEKMCSASEFLSTAFAVYDPKNTGTVGLLRPTYLRVLMI